mgnify:CR=1 FL=1
MKLTREECIKHFDNFSLILFNELDTHQLSGITDEEQDTLWRKLVDSSECFELLIDEHFGMLEHMKETSLYDVYEYEEKFVEPMRIFAIENERLKKEVNDLRKQLGLVKKYKIRGAR